MMSWMRLIMISWMRLVRLMGDDELDKVSKVNTQERVRPMNGDK